MVAAFAASAGAQQKACELDEGTPSQVARANFDLQVATNSGKPDDIANKLKDAVKLLNDGDLKKNPSGRAMLLGRALVIWMQQPSMASGTSTRGAVGFIDNPTAPYDLIGGIDSAFTVVETMNPECASMTAGLRQQKAWADMINNAAELFNSDKTDSAAAIARKSLRLSKRAPYGYMILARVAAKGDKYREALDQYKLSIAAAQDTLFADQRRQLLSEMGKFAMYAAQNDSTNRAAYIADAKEAYNTLAKDPGAKYADEARQGLADVAMAAGDTSSAKATYAEQLANPSAFSYNSLLFAAVTAAKTNQTKDAIKLFEAARATNSASRDVLYNLARLYLLDSAYTKGIGLARQLLTVDPANPDNYQLMAIGYQAIQRGYMIRQRELDQKSKALGQRANTSKSAAVQKAAIDSASRITPLLKAYEDSVKTAVDSNLKYSTTGASLPIRVNFTEFAPTDAKTSAAGTVSNNGDAEKTVALKIDFLDKTGNVVTTQTVNVGPIPAHGSARFRTEATGAGIIAFRYAPPT